MKQRKHIQTFCVIGREKTFSKNFGCHERSIRQQIYTYIFIYRVFSPSFLKKTDKNLYNIIGLINDNFKCCSTAYEQRPKSPRDNKSPPTLLVKTV